MKAFILMIVIFCVGSAEAATWYVDSTATGTHDGTSWANAWTGISQISGVGFGDTVYFSGGPSGKTETYALPSGGWTPSAGTYQIGQDASHNGTAIFTGSGSFIQGAFNGVTVSGNAGDGAQHFQVGSLGAGSSAISCDNTTGLTVSYINFGQKSGGFVGGNPCSGIQIDHCYYYKLTNSGVDSVIWMNMPTNLPFNNTRIFNNQLFTPFASNLDGWGDDVIGAASYSGLSFHDNSVVSYPITNYAASQHQDGMQILWGNNIKVYNNYFQDITNYPVYGDAIHGGMTNVYVFNNIVALVSSTVQGMNSPQGIAIGSEMTSAPFRNVVVSNNLIADYTYHNAANVGDGGSGTISFQGNNGLWNNISTFNTSGFRGMPTASVANINNVNLTSTSSFVSYTQNKANTANFHLVAGASTLIGQGTNLSSNAAQCPEIMFDRDGKARPSSGAWDIGPYQAGGATSPPLAPQNLRITAAQ